MRGFVAVVAIVLGTSVAAANPPALGATFTAAGLDTVGVLLKDVVNQFFQDVSLPDMSLSEHVDLLGTVDIDLTDIKVQHFSISAVDSKLSSPANLGLGLHNLNADITLNWSYKQKDWPHIRDHGSLTAKPEDGTLGTTLEFTLTNGVLSVTSADTTCDFSKFDLHFDGGASWLYNIIADLFKGTIGRSVESAVKKELDSVVDQTLAAALRAMPTEFYLGSGTPYGMNLDATFAKISTLSGSEFLVLENDFSFADNNTGVGCPNTVTQLPPYTPAASGAEFQLLLSDTVFSCPLWVLYTNGVLTFDLSAKTEPSLAKYLNTKVFGDFIPPLSAKYPDSPLDIAVTAASEPTISASAATAIVADVNLNLNMSVVGNSSNTHACTLGMQAAIGLDVFVNQTTSPPEVQLQLSELNMTLSVVDSAIGSIDVSTLDNLIKFALPLLKSTVDKDLKAFGIPLPTIDGVGLVHPALTYYDGYFAVTSNLTANLQSPTPAVVAPVVRLALRGSA